MRHNGYSNLSIRTNEADTYTVYEYGEPVGFISLWYEGTNSMPYTYSYDPNITFTPTVTSTLIYPRLYCWYTADEAPNNKPIFIGSVGKIRQAFKLFREVSRG